MKRVFSGIGGFLLVLGPSLCHADASVAELLEMRSIEPSLPLIEVQRYADARIPKMPVVDSAEQWSAIATALRQQTLGNVVLRGEAQRWSRMPLNVEYLETIPGGPGYRIRKLRYEAVPGLWIPALLYEPENLSGRVPVVLNVNGHDRNGKAAEYKQIRCINQAKRGMLALNVEWMGMGQLRSDGHVHYRMNQIDLCGTSGLAPFYLAMKHGLDLLLAHRNADPQRVAVAGLSGGGWQTIFISALDERVTLSDPVAGYSSFRTRIFHHSDLGDSEQTPTDLATVVDYAHLTAMRAPRPTLLTFNLRDNCCFAADHALPPLLEAARPIYRLFGQEANLRSHVNYEPGSHNFDLDNRVALYRMFGEHFYPDDKKFNPREIPCDDEVKTAEELEVPLPEGNLDFNLLAKRLMEGLPKRPEEPESPLELNRWRRELRQLVRWKDLSLSAERGETVTSGDIEATYWRLRIGEAWTVPAVELSKPNAKRTAILVADGGKASQAETVENLLEEGVRVVAVDPFYLGESAITSRDFLFALIVSTIGDRPAGLQASQLGAVSRWLADRDGKPAEVISHGPRVGLAALIAAAVEDQAIGRVENRNGLVSLKQIVDENWTIQSHPELFCFGLLEQFDIPQLKLLANAPSED